MKVRASVKNYVGTVELFEEIEWLELFARTLDTNKDKDKITVVLRINDI